MFRKIFPSLIANKIVSVQPMSIPKGILFYLDHVYATTKIIYNDELKPNSYYKITNFVNHYVDQVELNEDKKFVFNKSIEILDNTLLYYTGHMYTNDKTNQTYVTFLNGNKQFVMYCKANNNDENIKYLQLEEIDLNQI